MKKIKQYKFEIAITSCLFLMIVNIRKANKIQNLENQVVDLINSNEKKDKQIVSQKQMILKRDSKLIENQVNEEIRDLRDKNESFRHRLERLHNELMIQQNNYEKARNRFEEASRFKLFRSKNKRDEDLNNSENIMNYYKNQITILESQINQLESLKKM